MKGIHANERTKREKKATLYTILKGRIIYIMQHTKLRNQIIFTLFGRCVNALNSPSIVDCRLTVVWRPLVFFTFAQPFLLIFCFFFSFFFLFWLLSHFCLLSSCSMCTVALSFVILPTYIWNFNDNSRFRFPFDLFRIMFTGNANEGNKWIAHSLDTAYAFYSFFPLHIIQTKEEGKKKKTGSKSQGDCIVSIVRKMWNQENSN